jgi:hypothetical protein
MLAPRESAGLAERPTRSASVDQNSQPGQLTNHAGRTPAMTPNPVPLLLPDPGVIHRTAGPASPTATRIHKASSRPPKTARNDRIDSDQSRTREPSGVTASPGTTTTTTIRPSAG